MKKRSLALMALLLAFAMLLSACGEFTDASGRPSGENEGIYTDPNTGEELVNPFTVKVTYNGQPYIPTAQNPVSVLWNDGASIHEAPLGPDGVARIGNLDGDYRVTLSYVPSEFTYNPNIYMATNDSRHVEIELQKLVPTTGKGLDLYNCIPIQNTGVYCIEVKNADQETYFEFAPSQSGTYSVESWMDTVQDEVDCNANYYGANIAYKWLNSTHTDGGEEGTYTKNFLMDVQIADENISKNGTGAAAFTFGVSATQKNGDYPIKVYIAIKLDGEFSLSHSDAQIMVPQAGLVPQAEGTGAWNWAELRQTSSGGSFNVFDSDNYRLWPKSQGGDGYYHRYDPSRYSGFVGPFYDATANNGRGAMVLKEYPEGYGPILYAKITEATRFLEGKSGAPLSLHKVEYEGNKALTVDGGTKNYKLFIEGYAALSGNSSNFYYFCNEDCPCRLEGTCESIQITGMVGACTENCKKCNISCRRLPLETIGQKGYADYCNPDGCYGVTEELKEFLQLYSINQLLFMDGQGWVETHPTWQVFAAEEDQWLWACGYYE